MEWVALSCFQDSTLLVQKQLDQLFDVFKYSVPHLSRCFSMMYRWWNNLYFLFLSDSFLWILTFDCLRCSEWDLINHVTLHPPKHSLRNLKNSSEYCVIIFLNKIFQLVTHYSTCPIYLLRSVLPDVFLLLCFQSPPSPQTHIHNPPPQVPEHS